MAQNSKSFVLGNGERKTSAISMRKRFKRLRVDMKEMGKEQQSVKHLQRQVEANLRANQEECERLRDETNRIIRQTVDTQARLALLFDVLKAREQGDFAEAARLIQLLREALGRDNTPRKHL